MPYLTPAPPATSPLLGRTRAALLILEHAERLDLPMPWSVEATDYQQRISLMFRSVAELAEWALWLEVPISEETYGQHVHHVALGEALDQPVRLVRVERTAA